MTDPIVRLREVSVRYGSSGPWAAQGIDLDVDPGAAIGIVGESGSGKSTIGSVICGLLPPTRGTVEVLGTPWARVGRLSQGRRAVQMIFQDPYASLNPVLNPLKTVAEVYRVWDRLSARDADRRAASTLEEVGITGSLLTRRASKLSGGQRQRVGIARVLACQPSLIVADEPTSALDVSVQATVLNLLLDLRASRDLTLVLISHDLSVVEYMTSYACVMYQGRIVERGQTQTLMSAPEHDYTKALIESIPRIDLRSGPADQRPGA